MANARWATDFRAYTATASSAATDHPATNVGLVTKPQRTWRSTAMGSQWLRLDLGATLSAASLYLGDANFSTVTIEGGSDGSTWPTSWGDVALFQDARTGRRKVHWIGGSPALNHRYLRLTPSGADAGATYFELGAAVVAATVTTLTRNVPAWRWETVEPESRLDLLGGAVEVNREGAAYVRYQCEAAPWTQGAPRAELLTLLQATRYGAAIVLDENRGRQQDACLVIRETSPSWDESAALFSASPIVLREVR